MMSEPQAVSATAAATAVRVYEGRWALVPELSFIDSGKPPQGITSTLTIEVDAQNVSIRVETVEGDGEPRITEIGGLLDGNWYAAGEPLRAERSFADINGSVLEYSLFLNDVNMSFTRWRVSADGILLASQRTEIRPPAGDVYRETRVYRRLE
jgi:hypothetical protein